MQAADIPASRGEAEREVFEQRRLAGSLCADQCPAIASRSEPGEELRPSGFVQSIAFAEHAMHGEGIVAGSKHFLFGVRERDLPPFRSQHELAAHHLIAGDQLDRPKERDQFSGKRVRGIRQGEAKHLFSRQLR